MTVRSTEGRLAALLDVPLGCLTTYKAIGQAVRTVSARSASMS